MLSHYKSKIEYHLQPLLKHLEGVHPNAITALGIIPQLLFFYFMYQGWYILALLALILSSLDILDGMVARKYGKVTAFGSVLDSTMDRVSDFLILAGFYWGGLFSLKTFLVLLVLSYLISYVRSRAELASSGTVKFDVGVIERTERLVFLGVILLLKIVFPYALISGYRLSGFLSLLLIILSAYTLYQRLRLAYEKLN
jgi:phosphatidylglycerophosphate synthase